MLGQFTRQEQPNCSLDLPRSDRRPEIDTMTHLHSYFVPFVVVSQLASLGSDPLEKIIDEGVHDGHGL